MASNNRALEPKFEGPFSVIKRINAVTYHIDKNGVNARVHIKNIRPYSKDLDPIAVPGSLPQDPDHFHEISRSDDRTERPLGHVTRSKNADRYRPVPLDSKRLLSPSLPPMFPPLPPVQPFQPLATDVNDTTNRIKRPLPSSDDTS